VRLEPTTSLFSILLNAKSSKSKSNFADVHQNKIIHINENIYIT